MKLALQTAIFIEQCESQLCCLMREFIHVAIEVPCIPEKLLSDQFCVQVSDHQVVVATIASVFLIWIIFARVVDRSVDVLPPVIFWVVFFFDVSIVEWLLKKMIRRSLEVLVEAHLLPAEVPTTVSRGSSGRFCGGILEALPLPALNGSPNKVSNNFSVDY
ncbi:hypothetical protein BCR34DRAFT_583779 [Clohesyomyces aquaticus]|uniref:Uncharacterized protein n=1 Tax=Clohesyomyces aquaticus TaxID=1231657 RepID=A0A1Y2A4A5_9PLEO|nr:hypothetical protein BCR34DRAFT_583779 [Clohesyomyces aquaticus]